MRGLPSSGGWRLDNRDRHADTMNNDKAKKSMQPASPTEGKRNRPEWADGLRQLYDSVLNEPLPDSFADLISKLDESDK